MNADAHRARVYAATAGSWGEEVADSMMTLLPPNPESLATKDDLENLRVALSGRIDKLEGKLDAQFGRIITVNAGMMFGFAGILVAAAKFA